MYKIWLILANEYGHITTTTIQMQNISITQKFSSYPFAAKVFLQFLAPGNCLSAFVTEVLFKNFLYMELHDM